MTEIASNQPNIAEIFSAAGTILTTIFAGLALYNWKDQKKYELRMDAIAKGRVALDLVFKLRRYEKSNELTFQSVEEDRKHYVTTFQSDRHLYEEILRIKAQLGDNYGESHKMTMFFEKTISVINAIKYAHQNMSNIIKNGITEESENAIRSAQNLIYFPATENDVSYDLEQQYEDMIKK
ncbi:hypothetical protein [Pedobacter antarcticus]|uniref:hypothetical protein n=1 Tax=Pedobacter antarcticus TaxID=34086 RepID=UPI00292E4EDD|nr:hypothetical protein [Pedobacter antarcticus]